LRHRRTSACQTFEASSDRYFAASLDNAGGCAQALAAKLWVAQASAIAEDVPGAREKHGSNSWHLSRPRKTLHWNGTTLLTIPTILRVVQTAGFWRVPFGADA
jgi:hypothetical protein